MSNRHRKPSRRHFVQGAAATVVGLPALSFADEKKLPANDRVNLGFIGVGMMNRGHLNNFLGQKDVQVVAVCDVDTTRREAAKKTVETKYAEQMNGSRGVKSSENGKAGKGA